MTRLLARISTSAEAEQALACGIDIADISVAPKARQESLLKLLHRRIQILAAEDGAAVDYVLGGKVPGKTVLTVEAGTPAFTHSLRPERSHGAQAVLLVPPPGQRLFVVMGPEGVSAFVSACHEAGIEAWIGGRLEPPDAPRLLEHDPDVICVDGSDIEQFRALIPRQGATGLSQGEQSECLEGDHVLVRDFILPVQIGAYGFEKERPQRVCFNIDAEVRRRTDNPEDMRDVFSYDIILDGIRALVAGGHIILVETLAERTAQKVLRHPDVLSVKVRVEKLDLGPAAVGVEIVRKRSMFDASQSALTPEDVSNS